MPPENPIYPGGAFLEFPEGIFSFPKGHFKGATGAFLGYPWLLIFQPILAIKNHFQIFDKCKTKCKHHIDSFLRDVRGKTLYLI